MWVLFIAVLLPVSENPDPTARLYQPKLPWIEWSRSVDLKEAAPVVVVAARLEDAEPPVIFGNGVVIESRDASSKVLTCAHVVRHMSKDAVEIRTGVFRHSFAAETSDHSDYQEFEARLLRADDNMDLAILEIPVGGIQAARIGAGVRRPRQVISIVPFGRPTTMRGFHPFLQKGQSGSPDLSDGVVFGIARGMRILGGRPRYGSERFVGPQRIEAFLEDSRNFPPNMCDPSV